MKVRDFQPEDYPHLLALWEELGLNSRERGDDLDTILRTIKLGGKLLVMEDPANGKIIGSSWMTYDGRRILLHHFGIKKSYQRKGLGFLLVKASLVYIKAHGSQVKLEVHKDNFAAQELYKKAGFFAFVDYDILMIRNVKDIPF